MSRSRRSFSPEFRDEAVKMVDGSRSVAAVARELGLNAGTLVNWVAAYRREHPEEEEPLTVSERARLKNEWLSRITFTTRTQERQAVVKYIEGFYNRTRLHSGLDYKPPRQVYDEYLNRQLAA